MQHMMFITVKIFFFYYYSYFQKKNKRAHTKKNICIHTSDNTRGVHNQKKLKESKKRRGSVWYEIVLKKQTRFYLYIPERET